MFHTMNMYRTLCANASVYYFYALSILFFVVVTVSIQIKKIKILLHYYIKTTDVLPIAAKDANITHENQLEPIPFSIVFSLPTLMN